MSNYAVIEAPGYHGSVAVVVGSYVTADEAKRHAGKGWAVYQRHAKKGDRVANGLLANYRQGSDGVYRLMGA